MCTICNLVFCMCKKDSWLEYIKNPVSFKREDEEKLCLPLFKEEIKLPIQKTREERMVKCPFCKGRRSTPLVDGGYYWCSYCNFDGMVEKWKSF